MAAQVPAALKSADITAFAHRAAQLEKVKPIISYWCDYWIVNQILSKGLHNADQECLVYTTSLMDKLEQFKSEHAEEPAVSDDVVGKAYVEQFALETLERADNAVRANKATKQTADTFRAAATFLELLQIWGPLHQEISGRIKYAKYHAVRIVKAIQAGEDPNLSNPKPETPSGETLPALDPSDAEVQALEGGDARPRQPSATEVPDEADKIQKSLAQRSSLDESLHPSRDRSIPPPANRERQSSVLEIPDGADRVQSSLAAVSTTDESIHSSRAASAPHTPVNDVSPVTPRDAASFYKIQAGPPDISPLGISSERKESIGGNYFPRVPSPQAPELPSAPTTLGGDYTLPSAPTGMASGAVQAPPPPSEPSLASGRSSLAGLNQPSRASPSPPPHRHGQFLPQAGPGQPPQIPPNLQPQVPQPQLPQNPPQLRQTRGPVPPVPQPQQQHFVSPSPIHPVHLPPAAQPVNEVVDEEAIMKAQKHARWAISALNFEDVPTAIRELKGALALLGAT
ncbi:hypothetical protein A1O1_05253 [Capronia coronata CBS 617.96]|uniref:Vacuolar protein sorting-associated protein VTA1 n=1 Tax=Capronia coronata CBS 617.96 TaxID=1182541 RepID=W9Y714_9EURO|nr:uncharacterized protein A1O1_05253 [Capronia coronata CBS 617.96]EXJ88323.1 hypothetical protein A1O1_05253 [Capronia coronata CBS 617.96]